jgi:hypothetical protein
VNKYLKRLLIAWFLLLACVLYKDYTQPVTYTEYSIVDKATSYSYYKNSSTQINILILMNNKTNNLESKNVSVVTHYSAKVGSTLKFEDDPIYSAPWLLVVTLFGIIGFVCVLLWNSID